MRAAQLLLLTGIVPLLAGCAMCSSCEDYNYAAFGGAWQRTDMRFGRVGSAFTASGVKVIDTGPALRSEPTAPTAPNVEELTKRRSFWEEDDTAEDVLEGEADSEVRVAGFEMTEDDSDEDESALDSDSAEEEAGPNAATTPFMVDDPLAEAERS